MTNSFKGLDLIECLKNYELRFLTLHRRQWSRPSSRKQSAKKAKWLSEEALQIAEKRRQASVLTHIYGVWKDVNDNPICKTERETQRYRTVFWTLWEKGRVGWFERIALKHVFYFMWNKLPVQVRFMRQGAQGWCTGMTLRDGMGKKVGGGFRMGNTYTPMADSCQCMTKPLHQYCKIIKVMISHSQ